ncbi:hypothetical protein KC867_03300 [Candidatus Saccharibacteria bacterium]|nr:hypothetical protein [Candidatus Saccharibacteria bacterium]
MRTCEGLGVNTVYLTGYTPHPHYIGDQRLPHIYNKIGKQIQKTALGSQDAQHWQHFDDVRIIINQLKEQGYCLVALEQSPGSIKLPEFRWTDKVALLIGREVDGIESEILKLCDRIVEIPMFGQKESFNVAQATAMALYQLRFY